MLGSNTQAVDCTRGLTRDVLLQSFQSAAALFHAIDSPAQGVVVPFRSAGEKIISDLCSAQDLTAQWRLLRQAQQYTVSVYPQTLQHLREQGAIHEAKESTGVLYLLPGHYDDEFGLRVYGGGLMEGIFA
jgi:CRISPR-associated endonuclease/helicase Cas3